MAYPSTFQAQKQGQHPEITSLFDVRGGRSKAGKSRAQKKVVKMRSNKVKEEVFSNRNYTIIWQRQGDKRVLKKRG